MTAALDLGALVGRVALNAVEFDRTYVRVVRQMADLGAKAEASTVGTSALDKGLTGVAGASDAATAGLGGANKALTETGLAASRAAAATQAAAGASSDLQIAQLRLVAAQERLLVMQADGTATAGKLATAQAAVLSATDRVAAVEARTAAATEAATAAQQRQAEMAVRAAAAESDAATAAAAAAAKHAEAVATVTRVTGASSVATTEAGLASSKLTQAQLRQTAAQERLSALQESGTATTRQLAAAQATLIAANDRVAISQERAAQSMVFGARSADTMRSRWEAIPAPVKIGAAAIAVAAVESLKAASNYQKLTVNLVTGAGETQRNLKMVSDGILHMSGQVGDSASTLAKAMFTVESAGFHGAAALTLLKTAAEGAKVDNADLTVVVDALTSAMNAYHEPASNAAKVTNTLIASAAVGKMHLQDLAASLGTVLPSAAALRVPLDQVGAALATMTAQGTNADRAATYLRFAFAALANPTDKAQKSMKAVGLTSQQVADTMTHGGLPAVFSLLQTAVGEKFPAGSARYLAALANMVGGTRGLQAVLELTGSNLTSMDRNLAAIQTRVHDAGNKVSDWSQVQKNLNVQWSQFVDGLGAAGIKLGEVLLPAAADLLHVLNDTGSAVVAVAGFFEHNTLAAAALGTVLGAMLIPKVIEMTVWLGRVIALNAAAAFLAVRAAVAEAAAAFVAADGAVAGFGAAMMALDLNPVILALTAVVAAGAAMWHILGGGAQAQERAGARAVDDYVRSLGPLHDSLDVAQQHADDLRTHMLAAFASFGSGNLDHDIGAMKEWAKQAQAAGVAAKQIASNEAGLQNQFGLSRRQVETLARAYGIDLTGSYQQVAAAIQGALTPTQQITANTKLLGQAAQGSADEVKALTAALDLFAGNAISADQGAIAFRNDIAALDKALHKSAGAMGLNTQAGRDARDAFDTAAQQALNTAEAQAKLSHGTDKARATLQNEIAVLKAHAGNSDYARQAIHRLTDALDNLPRSAGAAASGLSAKGKVMADAAASDASLAAKAITGGIASARRAGGDFGQGYADGITAKQRQVAAAAAHLGNLAASALKAAQRSFSPSKVAFGLGSWWGEGYEHGITSTRGRVANAAAGLAMSAAQGAAAATRKVYATIAAAVAPTVTDPAQLAAILATDTASAVGKQQNASIAKAHYVELEQHAQKLAHDLSALQRADKAAQEAADKHATALSNEAHAAHEAAANMSGTGKAAAAAKHQAEVHARALDDEARAARQAATDLRKADADQEKAAQHLADAAQKQADRAKQAYGQMSQAAQDAANAAAQAAQQLVQSVQASVDQMLSDITSFEATVQQGITGDYSLATIWQSLVGTDANGNPVDPTAAQVQQALQTVLGNAQNFSNDINSIIAEGGGQGLVTQILQMGPDAGDAFAKAILAAGPDMVASFNSVLDSISSVAASEAQLLGNDFYGAGVSALEQFIEGLVSKFPELAKALQPIIDALTSALGLEDIVLSGGGSSGTSAAGTKKKGKGSGTTVPAGGWGWPGGLPHFATGVTNFTGGLAYVGERGPEVVSLPAGASVYPHGSMVTATLAPDDRALLRQVVTTMQARPVVLAMTKDGRRVIGEVAQDHRTDRQLHGDPGYLN